MKHSSSFVAFILVFLCSQLRGELPPVAQEAFKKGLGAAQQQEWEVAIRSFQEALKAAPDAPELFYNLGLAESKIPGRELRAIAWFGAYLAAKPTAPNADAVNDVIDGLKIKSEGNLSRLIKTVQDAASQLPDKGEWFFSSGEIAALWAGLGDSTTAQKIADTAKDPWHKNLAEQYVAVAQAKAGDIAGAQKSVNLIRDVHGSENDAANQKITALKAIAEAQVKAKELNGALNTLSEALKTLGHLPEFEKSSEQVEIAVLQARAGDIKAAQRTVDLIPDKDNRSHIKGGSPFNDKKWAQGRIAYAQAETGDTAGGLKTVELLDDNYKGAMDKKTVKDLIFILGKPQVKTGPSASDWVKMLEDDYDGLNRAIFLDLAGHLKSLPYDDSNGAIQLLRTTARDAISAHNYVNKMLKQQVQEKSKH